MKNMNYIKIIAGTPEQVEELSNSFFAEVYPQGHKIQHTNIHWKEGNIYITFQMSKIKKT